MPQAQAPTTNTGGTTGTAPTGTTAGQVTDRTAALAENKRIVINSEQLQGSINLTGGRLDDRSPNAAGDDHCRCRL